MIELYAPGADLANAEFGDLVSKGVSLLGRRKADPADAIRPLFAALRFTHVPPKDYARAVSLLLDTFERTEHPREALTLCWFLGQEPSSALLKAVPASDRARTLGARSGIAAAREAAATFESAGQIVKAAIAYETAQDWQAARALWSRLATQLGRTTSLYEAALASYDVCRTSLRLADPHAAGPAGTTAVHLIEEAADRFESSGQRERAFDCYQVLLAIGRETKTFEHVLEGYVNVLRILSEDHLRQYALQTYAEAIESARAEGELNAAATLAREMGEYARKEGESDAATRATKLEADLWREAAKGTLAREGSKERAEHALLSAALSLAEIGHLREVFAIYEELARIAPDERRRAHYAKSAARYANAPESPKEAPREANARREVEFPPVWHIDLVEWEEAGSAAETCAGILLDPRARSEATRRRALLTRLIALSAETDEPTVDGLLLLAQSMTTLELYEALSPLEKLSRHPDAAVRQAAVRSLSRFHYKRTFGPVRDRLADPSPHVAQAAAETVERLVFAQAIDPLSRLYREQASAAGRFAALRALAKIEHPDAAEVLLSAVAYGTKEEREAAIQALTAARGGAFVAAARAALPELDAHAKAAVRAALDARTAG